MGLLPLKEGGACLFDSPAESRPVALQSGSDEYAGIAAPGDDACDFSVGMGPHPREVLIDDTRASASAELQSLSRSQWARARASLVLDVADPKVRPTLELFRALTRCDVDVTGVETVAVS